MVQLEKRDFYYTMIELNKSLSYYS